MTRELAPPLIRWGGCFTDLLPLEGRRRAARASGDRCSTCLGRRSRSNQVGTEEFVDFCRQVGAEPLICVNFESDGREHWAHAEGQRSRTATAQEAADWVSLLQRPGQRRTAAARRVRAVRRQALADRQRDLVRHKGFDLRDGRPQDGRVRQGDAARPIRRSSSSAGATAAGRRACSRSPASTSSTSPSITCSTPTREEPALLRGELYRQDPAATWDALMKAWEIARRQDPPESARELREYADSRWR